MLHLLFLTLLILQSFQIEIYSSTVHKNIVLEFGAFDNSSLSLYTRTRSRYGYHALAITKSKDNFKDSLVFVVYLTSTSQMIGRVIGHNSSFPITNTPFSPNGETYNVTYSVRDINDYPFGFFVDETILRVNFNRTEFTSVFGNNFTIWVGANNKDYPNSVEDFKVRFDQNFLVSVNLSNVISYSFISLNSPYQRLEILHPSIYAISLFYYLVTFILLIVFSRRQPLLSRSSTPFIGCIAQFLHLLADIPFYFLTFEENTYYCVVQYLFQYSFLLIIILTSLLHFFRYVILINFAQKKKLFVIKEGEEYGTVNIFFLILKKFEKWYVNVILVVASWVLVSIIFLAIFIITNFQCNVTIIQYVYVALVALITVLFILVILYDLFLNFNKIRKCKLLSFWKDDVFYFRFEVYFLGILLTAIPFFIFYVVIYQLLTPILVSFIANSYLLLSLFFYQCLFPLIMTIIFTLIDLCKKKTHYDEIQYFISHPERYKLFMKFSKKEFSFENLQCWKHVELYKKETDPEKRGKIARDIYKLHLSGGDSPLELNLPKNLCAKINDLIQSKNYPPDLFNIIERELMANISDTWSRFILSRDYREAVIQQKIIAEYGKMKMKDLKVI